MNTVLILKHVVKCSSNYFSGSDALTPFISLFYVFTRVRSMHIFLKLWQKQIKQDMEIISKFGYTNVADKETHLYQYIINPRLTKGGGYNPPTVFSRPLQYAKESDLLHILNLFAFLASC